ncbi:sulfite exporter TauE/SafE family protein [Alphaproteobacteria bacterium]|nr:sulfite exporter TauE/SafE family protein [Alphaproteobacteria bacterium]MDA9164490.1 sulfite exporter TauE/SafE family protein [Alphaproteobacteria bacterium]MDC1086174.1 sulfite exporter TauE/SafE family protein [Alphaproteobacteria bacterium]MDC3410066.1 sulfite exporter TauE/SafE family protein [Alphaproteobacteria bacterium]
MDISNNPNEIAIIVGLAFLIAGIVKGVIGIGLPTTAITIMTFFVSPLMALGLNLIPMTVANFWQFSKADEPKELMKSYKYFAISLVLCILITSFYANQIGDNVVRLIFAIAVLLFVILQVSGFKFKMKSSHDTFWQGGLGALGGLIGGAASIWAVPVTMYLLMKNVKPKEFVDISGFLIMIGCIPVSIGYIATGVFQSNMFIYGALGSVVAVIGFQIGEKLRNKVNAKTFKNLLLIFFSISAINMIIRSFLEYNILN